MYCMLASVLISLGVDAWQGNNMFCMEEDKEVQRTRQEHSAAAQKRQYLENSGWGSWWERGWFESQDAARQRRDAELAEARRNAEMAAERAERRAAHKAETVLDLRPIILLITEDVPQFGMALAAAIIVKFDVWIAISLLATVVGFGIKAFRIQQTFTEPAVSTVGAAAEVIGNVV